MTSIVLTEEPYTTREIVEHYIDVGSKCVLVLDIPSTYLVETALDLTIAKEIIESIYSLCSHIYIYANPIVGSVKEIHRLLLQYLGDLSGVSIIDLSKLKTRFLDLYTQGLKLRLKARVYDLNEFNNIIFLFHPRTCDWTPIMLSIPQYAIYTIHRDDMCKVLQGFIATHLNILRIFKTIREPSISIAILSKIVEGDGPVYGDIRIPTKSVIAISDNNIILDLFLAKLLNIDIKTIGYLELALKTLSTSQREQILSLIESIIDDIRKLYGFEFKFKLHNLYRIAIEFWRSFKKLLMNEISL